MSIVASANDEISDQELISVTGIVTSNELISDHADNLVNLKFLIKFKIAKN
ncbi:unnamed protein product [Brugia timori]|uniref:Uncharacterized protein n=1 Tax=Brugia timori TaxID=42155 RepID=A0A0R3QGV2_9BILA|nr:unnamed protein product [Brugia timori]